MRARSKVLLRRLAMVKQGVQVEHGRKGACY